MAARWRQENYFKYAREHFALDALDSYADSADDLSRLVPNPAKTDAHSTVNHARAQLAQANAALSAAIEHAGELAGTTGGTATVQAAAVTAVDTATAQLGAAQAVSRATDSRLTLAQVRPGS